MWRWIYGTSECLPTIQAALKKNHPTTWPRIERASLRRFPTASLPAGLPLSIDRGGGICSIMNNVVLILIAPMASYILPDKAVTTKAAVQTRSVVGFFSDSSELPTRA
jgi:hypothetical protein